MRITQLVYLLIYLAASWLNGAQAQNKIESWSDFTSLIQKNEIRNVDDLLSHLPEHFTKGYTLLYRPKALHRELVSHRRPRVLMYGRTGTFMMTYNSHPTGGQAKLGDVETIETLEYKNSRTYLREITFDGRNDPLSKPIEINPKSCTQCHGEDPRGLWDPYNSWPGVYGSLSRGGMDFIHFDSPEYQGFQEFLEEKQTNPRYSFLPVLEGRMFSLSQWSRKYDLFRPFKPGLMEDGLVISDGYTTLPNQVIGMILGEQNFQRLGRVLSSLPRSTRRKYQYFIKGISLDENYQSPLGKPYSCFQKIDSFFPHGDERFDRMTSEKVIPEIHFAIGADYNRQKALTERDNYGLSAIGGGFDSSDPFDLDIERRKLEYDPLALPYIFASQANGLSGSHILAYVLRVLGLESYEANISINFARYNFYYGNISKCHKPEKGTPYRNLCFDESVERFFSTYAKGFYVDPNIDSYSCEQLASLSRNALSR